MLVKCLLLFSVNNAHNMPACVVHHVFHEDSLDLLDSLFHLAHTAHRQSPESPRLYTKSTMAHAAIN